MAANIVQNTVQTLSVDSPSKLEKYEVIASESECSL